MASVKWLPLESNPEVMNQFLKYLGIPSKWAVTDVFSLDDELLALVPQPVLAVLLLFPITAKDEFSQKEEGDSSARESNISDKVYFMKQTIKNACGTVALIHSVANNLDQLNLDVDSPLQKFLSSTKQMSPEKRGKELENNLDIGSGHESCAQQGQTEAPNVDDDINLHFVALVNVSGQLYELDGRKPAPIVHGPTSDDSFLKDAAGVCKEFMKRDPENVRFTVLALGAAPS